MMRLSLSVRLSDGGRTDTSYYGVPAVFIGGTFKTIVGPSFTENAARVVCRELGYSFSKRLHRDFMIDLFSTGRTVTCIFKLNCTGNESSISECDISYDICPWNEIEDAVVLCSTSSIDDSKHRASRNASSHYHKSETMLCFVAPQWVVHKTLGVDSRVRLLVSATSLGQGNQHIFTSIHWVLVGVLIIRSAR